MSKKILVVAPYTYLPYRSGGQKYIAQFLEALGQQAKVTVVSTAQDTGYVPSAHYRLLPVLPYSIFRYADLTLTATLVELIERNRYDWIIWEHPYFGWLAKTIKEKTGIKTLLHTHNIEYQRFRSLGKIWWPLLEKYERSAFRIADKIGFITPEDKRLATDSWHIDSNNCLDIPYGISIDSFPTDKATCRASITATHQLNAENTLLFFNGSLDYAPNYKALQQLLKELMPRLKRTQDRPYTLLVCGKGLPKRDKELSAFRSLGVHYAGFVEDIDRYFKGADIFLNPVLEGGGIKTKMIESIAFGTPVVSMQKAATGLSQTMAGPMLTCTPDHDWDRFATAIETLAHSVQAQPLQTPAAFYEHHNWTSIIERLLVNLSD
ncbi:MAG: glycosyltransferase family 4 protein [Sphingomonadales bacterium]